MAPSSEQPSHMTSDLLMRIENELTRHDDAAKSWQISRWWVAIFLILLGPAAVVCSAFHSVWENKPPIMFEVGFLLAAVVVSYWPVGRWHERWIQERLRTELLRREYFLFRARVGPYLHPNGLAECVETRVREISGGSKDPVELVPMVSERGDRTWRDELEDAGGRSLPALQQLPSAIEHYLKRRVEDQRSWFTARKSHHRSLTTFFEGMAKVILVAALVVAILHLSSDHRFLVWGGISLPAIGAALVAVQSLLENERLGHSYAYYAELLENFASGLRTLQSKLGRGESAEHEVQFQFMRIVLEVEAMFSAELLQWHLVMKPRAPRAEV